MKVKYTRISSDSQNEARQKTNLTDFKMVYSDVISGSVAMAKRPEGGRLIADIQAGKISELYVTNFDRLGRNAADCLNTIEICNTHKVCVTVETMGLKSMVDGKPNPMFKMASAILSCVAEQERDNIRERCKQGMVVARLAGKRWGRVAGEKETRKTFLSKPKVVSLVNLMKKKPHLTTRELASVNNCSLHLVVKVRKLMPA